MRRKVEDSKTVLVHRDGRFTDDMFVNALYVLTRRLPQKIIDLDDDLKAALLVAYIWKAMVEVAPDDLAESDFKFDISNLKR